MERWLHVSLIGLLGILLWSFLGIGFSYFCVEFHRLRYFLEVVRQGQFSRAAEVCFISQPSLSQQIAKLEDEVGGSLFLRLHGGVKLTELGEDFLPHARAIMAEVESAREFRSRLDGRLRRPVRVGAIPTIAPYLLPELVRHIRGAHADAEFELVEATTGSLVESLRLGRIDCALLSPPTEVDGEVDFLDVCDDELLLTLPEDHELCGDEGVLLEDLGEERLVLLEDAHCLSRQSEGFCAAAGLKTDVTIRSSQIDTLLGMVELGMGFTFTPAMAVRFHEHRRVRFQSIRPDGYVRKIRLVWMKGGGSSVLEGGVLECLRRWCGLAK